MAKITCCFIQAAKRNLVYPHYAWIIYAWYPERWWLEEIAGEHIDECSDEELQNFMLKSRAIEIHIFPEADDLDNPTVTGYVRAFVVKKCKV